MCTPIRSFTLTNTIFKNHDNSGYTGNLYTVSTGDPVLMFIFLIYSLVLCWGKVSNSNVTTKFAQLHYFWSQNVGGTRVVVWWERRSHTSFWRGGNAFPHLFALATLLQDVGYKCCRAKLISTTYKWTWNHGQECKNKCYKYIRIAKVHSGRKAENTANLTKEVRKRWTMKDARNKYGLLKRLNWKTGKQACQNCVGDPGSANTFKWNSGTFPVKVFTNHVLVMHVT